MSKKTKTKKKAIALILADDIPGRAYLLNKEYKSFLEQIKRKVYEAQYRAMRKMKKELIGPVAAGYRCIFSQTNPLSAAWHKLAGDWSYIGPRPVPGTGKAGCYSWRTLSCL